MSNIKKNLFYLVFAQAVSYLFPLLTLPYLSHKLNPEQFGVLGISQAIVQYFIILTDYGFNITTTKDVSLNRNNKLKLSMIFSTTLVAKLFLLSISFLGVIISLLTIETIKGNGLILLACFTGVIGNAIYPLWLFQGIEMMKIPVLMSTCSKLFLLAGIFYFVKDEGDIDNAALLLNAGNLLAGVLGLLFVYKRKLVSWYKPAIKDIFNALTEGWPVFISTVAISFYSSFNTILLSYHTNTAEIGYYNAADRIRIAVQSMFGPVTQAFYPRIVHLYKNNKQEAVILSRKGLLLMFGITVPAALILFFFSRQFVSFYLDSSFAETAEYLKLLSFLPVVIAVATVYCNWGLLGNGYGKLVSKIYIFFGILHFVYATPLIIYFKVDGLIASVYLTQIMITAVTVHYYYLKVLGRDRHKNGN